MSQFYILEGKTPMTKRTGLPNNMIVILIFKFIIFYPIVPFLWLFYNITRYQIKIIAKVPPFFGYHFYKKIEILEGLNHNILSCFCCKCKKLKLWYCNRMWIINKYSILSKKQKKQYDNIFSIKEYISDLPFLFIFLFKYSLFLAIIRDYLCAFFREFELYGVPLYYRFFYIFFRLRIFNSFSSMHKKHMRKYYRYGIS